MITEDYVSFEIAKLLKEKGFDGYCFAFHKEQDKYESHPNSVHFAPTLINNEYLLDTSIIICPTLQMTMKWLRENHNIKVNIFYNNSNYTIEYFEPNTQTGVGKFVFIGDGYPSYEQACESAIKYCLENLI